MELIDVVIRNTVNSDYELVAAQTFERLSGPYPSFAAALAAAKSYTVGDLFHQVLDSRGGVVSHPWLIHTQDV